MRRMSLVAAVVFTLGTAAAAAADEPSNLAPNRPATPAAPPTGGNLSSDLNRSGGVIKPPAGIDPEIKQTPPPTGATMPVIPPPGTPGGNPAVKPK